MYPFHLSSFLFFSFPFNYINVFPADVVLGGNVVLINKNVLLFSQWQLAHIIFIFHPSWKFEIRVCSDNSLARPTYCYRRTKSIASFEREVCSTPELEVSSGFRGWKNHLRVSGCFKIHWDASCHRVFFFLHGKVTNEIHAILTETRGVHAPRYDTVKGWVVQLNVAIFPPVLHSFCKTQNCDHLGIYWSN